MRLADATQPAWLAGPLLIPMVPSAISVILAHFFDDKADILGSALVMSHRRVGARMDASTSGHRVLYPDRVPPQRQTDLLDALLSSVRAARNSAVAVQTSESL